MINIKPKVKNMRDSKISNGVKKNLFSKIFLAHGLLSVFLTLGIVVPLSVSAQAATGLGSEKPQDSNFQIVPCNAPPVSYTDTTGKTTTNSPTTGVATTPCDFYALIELIQRIINFLLYAAMFVAVLGVVQAGFIYLTAGGDTGKTKKALEIFKVTVIGFAIALCSWLVVYTVINAVISPAFLSAYPTVTKLLKKQ